MSDMNNFEQVLDQCLQQMVSSRSSVEDCLRQYPEQAAELKPLLQAAARLERGRGLGATPAFKGRARAQLMAHARSHPRQHLRTMLPRAWRTMATIAVLVVVLMLTGTAFAQAALPGEPLYSWKLTSEQAWRAVAPDRIGVDLSLADRRAGEVTAVSKEGGQRDQAIADYHEALSRLDSEVGPADSGRLLQILELHKKNFNASGIDDPELDKIIREHPGKNPGKKP